MKVSVKEAIRMIAARAGKSLAQISREVTDSTPAAFVNMVSRGSMKMSVGAMVGEKCGYKLMYVPVDVDIEDGIEIRAEG